MQHRGTQTIETERLVLRRLRPDDAEAMFANWASNPNVTRYLTWAPHENVDTTRELLEAWEAQYESDAFYQWGIELRDLGEVIGTISVVGMDEGIEMLHIGYCIGEPWWHRGIMTEAFSAVIGYLFAEVGCNRIESHYDTNNPHSGDVMRKCGLAFEGVLRSAGRNNQGLCDMGQYAILRADWPGAR